MKPSGCYSRYFDLRELFSVQFGQQVNQVQSISYVHDSHPELLMADTVERDLRKRHSTCGVVVGDGLTYASVF